MRIIKLIGIIALLLTLSLNLEAKDSYHMNYQDMRKHHEFFEKLTPEQREKIMDLRAEFVHKEFHLSHEMRSLRVQLNSCMIGEEIDIDKYQELRKRAQKLRRERLQLRMKYRKQLSDIADNGSTIEENQ